MQIDNYDEFLDTDLVKDYKSQMISTIKNTHPEFSEKDINKTIDKLIKEKVKDDPIIEFNNNYKNTNKKLKLSRWYSWYKLKKPITTEHGVCFKRHDESINLSASLLEFILDTRKKHKKQMFDAKQKGDKENEHFHSIRQKVYKIFANSYYGAMGQRQSIFYNLYTALSVTGKGQSLITNAEMSFEVFFADNFYFENLDDFYIYISNIKNEKRTLKMKSCLDSPVKKKDLYKRICKKFKDSSYVKKNKDEIIAVINNLSSADITKIYYKNNFYEFSSNPKILNKILDILGKVEEFNNPNDVPEIIKDDLEELWLYYKEFVYYPYTLYDHITIGKSIHRKSVVTIDTDSNMVNIEPFLKFISKKSKNYRKENLTETDTFKIVNIATFILTKLIGEVHERYTGECNVPEDKRPIINMKNEFLMKRMVITNSKKNYASILLLQEGVKVKEEDSLDIKGLTIKKSNVNKNVGNAMQDILKEEILEKEEISLQDILRRLSALEEDIRTSLNNGQVTYLKPDKSNEPESYKTPFQQPAVRGIYSWNILYPEKEISYPAQINLLKIKKIDLFNLERIMNEIEFKDDSEYEKIYNGIESILNNENFSNYGFSVLAIPKTEIKIPKWIIPLIDVEQIVFDSMTNFNKILQSVNIHVVSTDKKDDLYYSNIIDF